MSRRNSLFSTFCKYNGKATRYRINVRIEGIQKSINSRFQMKVDVAAIVENELNEFGINGVRSVTLTNARTLELKSA